MAEGQTVGGHVQGVGATRRTDNWWLEPLWTGLGFALFSIYTTWAAFQGAYYWVGDEIGGYLSPFYSPVLFVDTAAKAAAESRAYLAGQPGLSHAWFGEWPGWLGSIWPSFVPKSPAWFILLGPLGFRMTCYYYRKFYYRAYFFTPPACAVQGVPQKKFKGETGLLLIQNLHRYMWYVAVGYIVILSYDAYLSYWREVGGQRQFGVGLGSIILTINPILLGLYTFGCHSCRNLVGGRKDCFTCDGKPTARYGAWKKVTSLNERHMLWAWVSMVWVGFTDYYVRMVAWGNITDPNTWGM